MVLSDRLYVHSVDTSKFKRDPVEIEPYETDLQHFVIESLICILAVYERNDNQQEQYLRPPAKRIRAKLTEKQFLGAL